MSAKAEFITTPRLSSTTTILICYHKFLKIYTGFVTSQTPTNYIIVILCNK